MICVPVASNKIEKALEMIKSANETADMIELRLDFFTKLGEKELKQMLRTTKKPVICTCRRLEEGGLFRGTESQRISLLKKCMKFGADYIDVEFETKKVQKEKLKEYKEENKCKTKTILSKHYFGSTPEYELLLKLMNSMKKEKPDVIKIITKANNVNDNHIIFQLLKEAKRKEISIISFCMGPLGTDSRILSMPFGAFLTFASLNAGAESADGQIPIDAMKKIYAGLRVMM